MSSAPAAGARPTAEQLLGRVSDVVRREIDVLDSQLRRNDIAVIRGEADVPGPPHPADPVGDRLPRGRAATIVVAVGTRAVTPPGAVLDGEVAITSDDIIRLKRLPRAMTVVGGGVIGIEYASMFAALGIEVTVVERRDRVLEFVDREIVDELIHQMRKRNVTFRFGEAVERFEVSAGPPRRGVLFLESGKRIVSDLVLFSAGRTGATDELNLAAAGLDRRRAGPARRGRRLPDLGAAHLRRRRRDRLPEPGRDVERAGAAGRLPRLRRRRRADGAPLPRGNLRHPRDLHGRRHRAGADRGQGALRDRASPATARSRGARSWATTADSSRCSSTARTGDCSASTCIGTGATELIHIGQAVLGLGGGLDYFMRTVFNYPTLAECYKVAALDAANKLAT